MKPIILLFLSALLLGTAKKPQHLRKEMLVGTWKIEDVYLKNIPQKINWEPHCEDKETIVFTDSLITVDSYSYFKNRCHKSRFESKYDFETEYNSRIEKRMYLILPKQYQTPNYYVIELNDTILKLQTKYSDLIKCYKRVK